MVLDQSRISCPLEKHLQVDPNISLYVSFNRVEFHLVTNTLSLIKDIRIFPTVSSYNLFSETPIYSAILGKQGIADACPVVTKSIGSEIHLQSPALWNRDIFLQVSIND